MKRNFVILLFLSLFLFITGCGSNKEEKKDGKIKLVFYYPVNVGGPVAKLVEQLTKDFNAENPDIEVEAVYTGNYDDTVTKIQTAAQGGNPPDLFVSLATQRFTMASSEMAMPLDELIAEDGEEGKKYISDFLESFMEDSYVNGKIYSIPFQRSTMVLFYNKDVFKEAGLNPEKAPETWEELVEIAKKVTTDKRKGVGIALNSGSAQWAFTGFALQNSADGKNLMSEDGKKVFFNTPENVEALQFWIGHKRKGAPTGGGNFYISSKISKEKQKAAWKFIKYLTTAERAAQWSVDTGYVPTRKSAFETEIMKKYYAERPQAKVAYEQLKFAKPELTTYNAAEIWRILNDNIQSAITGEKTAKDALDNAQKEATEVLKDFN